MIVFRNLVVGLAELGISHNQPVLLHASLSAFGQVQGGAQTVLDALLYSYDTLVAPAFTYKTMLVPEVGPAQNGITYGDRDLNLMAEFFRADMPVDRIIGSIPETLRSSPNAQRTSHPILSFCGLNADDILNNQTLDQPLAPIERIFDRNGWVLLLGVDHTNNTSIHYAEQIAGRKQFVRWALTELGVVECPRFPGCSDGFGVVQSRLIGKARKTQIGKAVVQAFPLAELISMVVNWLLKEPLALLCQRKGCERCEAIRYHILHHELPVFGAPL